MSNELNRFLLLGAVSAGYHERLTSKTFAKIEQLILQREGQLRDAYALLGQYDLALIVDLPSSGDAVKLAVAIGKLLGCSITSLSAIPANTFGHMMDDLETEIESARMEAGE